jgi:hypothetical protein
LTINGGSIQRNIAANGGGVYNGGTFIMSAPGSTTAPTIQGNSAHWGGGVSNIITNGPALFTMWNGNILNNDAVANNALTPSGGMGGGIYNSGGSVTLMQGMVQGNEALAGSAGTNAQKAGKGGGIYTDKFAATRIFGPWANVNTNTPNNIWDITGAVT